MGKSPRNPASQRPVATRTSVKALNSDEKEDQGVKKASDVSVQPRLLEGTVQVMLQMGELSWEGADWVLCRTPQSSCALGGL